MKYYNSEMLNKMASGPSNLNSMQKPQKPMHEDWEKEFDKYRNDGEHDTIGDEFLNFYDVEMIKDFIRQLLANTEKKHHDWMREFALEMALLKVDLPQDLSDVKAVCEAIRDELAQNEQRRNKQKV